MVCKEKKGGVKFSRLKITSKDRKMGLMIIEREG